MKQQLQHVDNKDVHYKIPEPQGFQSDTTSKDEVMVKLQHYVPGIRTCFTLDDSDPTTHSAFYEEPVGINLKTKPTVRVNNIQVTPSGNISLVYNAD